MPLISERAWFRTLAQLGLLVVAGLAVGAALGHAVAGLAAGALLALAWQAFNLRRLLLRLRSQRRLVAGDDGGAWSEADRLLQRRQASERRRRRRLVDMLRAYRAAATALPDAVVVVDRLNQRVVWFNEAGTALLGLSYPADLGVPVVGRLAPLPLAHWLAQGRHAEPLEVASPLQPGVTLSLRLMPYSDDLWLLVARDVTRLLALEQMRRDFVANVSHELRTPLTVLHGYLDMLDAEDYPPWAPMLSEMQRQSSRMTQLVEDLLTLSRLEAREQAPLEETLPMAGMLATLRREAQALSQGRHEVTVVDEAGCDLRGSPKELHSAFSNLVANAVRYTPEGGAVRIDWVREDGGAALRVRDTGYGIAAAHLPRITERFYRVSSSRSRESGGTGLGLAIAKHVLNVHQARLEISSEVGVGSVFSCHFAASRIVARAASEAAA